jgi:hypothetical protein
MVHLLEAGLTKKLENNTVHLPKETKGRVLALALLALEVIREIREGESGKSLGSIILELLVHLESGGKKRSEGLLRRLKEVTKSLHKILRGSLSARSVDVQDGTEVMGFTAQTDSKVNELHDSLLNLGSPGLDVALLRETVGKESESILSLSNALEI